MERAVLFKKFVESWATIEPSRPETKGGIVRVEDHFGIRLPASFREFVLTHGAIHTCDLHTAIAHSDSNLREVHRFWPLDSVIESTEQFVDAGMSCMYIGFASDHLGNLFGFKVKECRRPGSDDAPVWFYNPNNNVVHQVAVGFTQWITEFVKVSKGA
jgi:hypothetical protein